MSRNFDLDTSAAKDANSGGKRITQPGPYAGTFRSAFYESNKNGTESVNLVFVAENGQEVGPIALYTHNGDGEALPSYKMLNAIMACMRLRKLESKPGKVTLYDFDRKAEVTKEKTCYPALVGPRIGLVLQGEEYENRNGEVKVRMVIAAAYDADSKRMADEVLTQAADAKALPKFLEWFEGHQVKPLRGTPRRTNDNQPARPSAADDFADDSDIPF